MSLKISWHLAFIEVDDFNLKILWHLAFIEVNDFNLKILWLQRMIEFEDIVTTSICRSGWFKDIVTICAFRSDWFQVKDIVTTTVIVRTSDFRNGWPNLKKVWYKLFWEIFNLVNIATVD